MWPEKLGRKDVSKERSMDELGKGTTTKIL
jgi:hypothetical protein